MDIDRILERIKKCIALASSSNEHEAAAALRQAQALMRKHNITQDRVLTSTVKTHTLRGRTKVRPATWEYNLVSITAEQFDCRATITRDPTVWTFIGMNRNPEIAAYAFEVLSRQVQENKAEFLKTESLKTHPPLTAGRKRRLGHLYCQGWVTAVARIIREFNQDSHASPAIAAYLKDIPIDKKGKSKREKIPKKEYDAYMTGIEAGQKAQLHRGVGEDRDAVTQITM